MKLTNGNLKRQAPVRMSVWASCMVTSVVPKTLPPRLVNAKFFSYFSSLSIFSVQEFVFYRIYKFGLRQLGLLVKLANLA